MALQDTPRELGFLGTQGLLALGQSRHSGTRRALRYSGTVGTWALGHSKSAWAQAFRHSGTPGTLFCRLLKLYARLLVKEGPI